MDALPPGAVAVALAPAVDAAPAAVLTVGARVAKALTPERAGVGMTMVVAASAAATNALGSWPVTFALMALRKAPSQPVEAHGQA